MPFKDVTDIVLDEEVKELEEDYKNDPEVREAIDQFRAECKLRKELKEARTKKNITQKDIQKKTGLTQQMISRIESNNEISPSMKNLIKYVNAIGYEITLLPKEDVISK